MLVVLVYALIAVCVSFVQVIQQRNPYGHAFIFIPLGAFVWGDALVLGLFWFLMSTLYFLFPMAYSPIVLAALFWLVRAGGEIFYWLLVQFVGERKEPASNHMLFPLVQSDAVWFMHQVIWQCVAVIASLVLIMVV